jgi:hypothetical protein
MNMNTSLRPTRAARNAMNAKVDAIKQGRKYGWSRRYANFPKESGQRTAGLENRPPMVGLELDQWEKSSSHNRDTLRKYSSNTPHNGRISKRICDICSVRYLERCQTLITTPRPLHLPRRLQLLRQLMK